MADCADVETDALPGFDAGAGTVTFDRWAAGTLSLDRCACCAEPVTGTWPLIFNADGVWLSRPKAAGDCRRSFAFGGH